MNLAVIVINGIAVVSVAASLLKSRAKTIQALAAALRSGAGLAPTLLGILVFIGLLLGFVPPATIGGIVGEGSGVTGVLSAGLLGSVLHIPTLVSFPLAGSLMDAGASTTVVAVFITTLTMVGFVTLPLEMGILGKRFALLRNGLSLVAAVIIGLLVGVAA
ncbi:MAG: permease [Myxococcota bacterium]